MITCIAASPWPRRRRQESRAETRDVDVLSQPSTSCCCSFQAGQRPEHRVVGSHVVRPVRVGVCEKPTCYMTNRGAAQHGRSLVPWIFCLSTRTHAHTHSHTLRTRTFFASSPHNTPTGLAEQNTTVAPPSPDSPELLPCPSPRLASPLSRVQSLSEQAGSRGVGCATFLVSLALSFAARLVNPHVVKAAAAFTTSKAFFCETDAQSRPSSPPTLPCPPSSRLLRESPSALLLLFGRLSSTLGWQKLRLLLPCVPCCSQQRHPTPPAGQSSTIASLS
jgi:hypothetical protein